MPKRGNKQRGASSQELSPWPVKWVPQKDVPTTQRNPKRSIVIDADPPADQLEVINISAGSIRNRIAGDTKVPLAEIYFVLTKSAYWASPGPGQITIQDVASGITVTDEGDYTNRARVGISYSKNIQKIVPPAAAGDPQVIIQTGNCNMPLGVTGTQVWCSRHWVTYWAKSSASA